MAKTKKNEKDYIDKPVFFAALNDFFTTVDISYEKTYGKPVTWRSEIFEKETSYEKWIKDNTKIWLENYYKQWLKITKKTPKSFLISISIKVFTMMNLFGLPMHIHKV